LDEPKHIKFEFNENNPLPQIVVFDEDEIEDIKFKEVTRNTNNPLNIINFKKHISLNGVNGGRKNRKTKKTINKKK
jgi:hypothetical protein